MDTITAAMTKTRSIAYRSRQLMVLQSSWQFFCVCSYSSSLSRLCAFAASSWDAEKLNGKSIAHRDEDRHLVEFDVQLPIPMIHRHTQAHQLTQSAKSCHRVCGHQRRRHRLTKRSLKILMARYDIRGSRSRAHSFISQRSSSLLILLLSKEFKCTDNTTVISPSIKTESGTGQ